MLITRKNKNSYNIYACPACFRYDFVEVREGRDEDSPIIGRYCGHNVPPPYLSNSNELFIRFKSDHSVSHTGFRISYRTYCGGTFTEETGVVTSPYHPNPYPSGRQCDYLIAQPQGMAIRIAFLDFEIEGSYNCGYDYLEIRDGDNGNSSLIGKFCGDPSLQPDPIQSTHNYLWMRFVTDGSVQNRGFSFNYTAIESGCGGIIAGESHGILQSPTESEYYPHGTRCVWIIRTLPTTIVRLAWMSFALEESSTCDYDYVEVYNDLQPVNGTLIGMYNNVKCRTLRNLCDVTRGHTTVALSCFL